MSEDDRRTDSPLLPLTAAQRGMWFAENMSADYSVNVAQYLDIRDVDRPLDVDAVVGMHDLGARELESAFTRLVDVDGTPMQYIDQSLPFTLEQVDLRSSDDPVAAAHDWMNDDYRRPVDLLSGTPLARAALLRVADDRVFWYLRGHHLLLDGFAALNSVLRLVERYNAKIDGREFESKPHADVAELVADDQAYAAGTRRARDREYWAERAADLPERVTLAQRAATAALSPVNLVAGRVLDAGFQSRLGALAVERSSSIAVLLTAGFSAYLARMTGTDEVVLSMPVTGRASAKTKRASGMVSNMLPVRASDVVHASFDELIGQIQLELTGVLRHQRYRFEDIRFDAGMRDASTASFGPIVNMVFFDKPIEITGAQVSYHILASGILEDLRINFYQASPTSPVYVDLHGNPNLYTERELSVHLDRFLAFFENAVTSPGAPLGEIALATDDDLRAVDDAGRGEDVDYTRAGTHLLEQFEHRVAERPDAVALRFEGSDVTYAEFDDMRRRLAGTLVADGVRPGDRVIVALDRGVDQIAAVYAVITAGAAYVPVDPSHPRDRRDLVADAAGARTVIDVDYLASRGRGDRVSTVALPPAAAAYVIFTSGSTGTPKGVQVPHGAVINRLAWTDEHYPLTGDDRVLYKTPHTFDVSVWELFWPLAVGATTVIAKPDGHRDPAYLNRVMVDERVSVLHFVPSMLDVYLDDRAGRPAGEALFADSVRRIFTSGEALTGKSADRVLTASDVDLINLYGPTEAAVDVTEHRVVAGEATPPIGAPVPNTGVLVLDDRLIPVPPGAPGELYLTGAQLAHGYIGRAALTSERFVACPGGDAARMYRTGDLVRWNADGELDYLGRTDFQVKIRGQRVELGEVESVLVDHADVDAAVAMVRDDVASTPTLVAYVRVSNPRTGEPELLAWSRRRLPSHMVPTAVTVLDDFPRNSSGKTDRRALPAPVVRTAAYEAPQSEIEIELAGIIADLLGIDRVGRTDNLFALGGNSLVAARLVTRARDGLGVDLRVSDVFEASDLAELAAGAVHADHDSSSPLVHIDPRPETIPLSTAQSRLWLVNQIDPTAATYNMPGAVRIGPDVDVDALDAAVRDVVRRHEILRSRFVALDDGTQAQVVGSTSSMADAIVLTPQPTDDVDAAVRIIADTGFDLTVDAPFRARLVRDAAGYVLVVVVHHIAADGYSLIPLIADLGAAYAARRAGSVPDLDWDGLQYADYAIWQNRHLVRDGASTLVADLDFWRTELADLPELLPLPTDRPRPAVASGRGAYVDLAADGVLAGGVRDLAKAAGVTPFSVIHAAMALVLARCSGTTDIAVGVAVDGRRDDRLNRLVGMFIDTVVLRTDVCERASLGTYLSDAHRVRARALSRATVPFERVVEALAPARSAAHTPLFQVGLTMLSDTTGAVRGASDMQLLDARVPAAKYDVSVTVTERADRLDFEVSYATDLFDRASALWFGQAVLRVLDQFTQASTDLPVAAIDIVDARSFAELTRPPTAAVDAVTLGDLWDAHGAADPGTVRDGDAVHTRADFDAASNRLARELIAAGVGPGDVVAVGFPRGVASVTALVAVTKAGAAFVSVDPALPVERRAEIVADSGAVLALGSQGIGGVDWIEPAAADRSGDPIRPDELRRAVHADDVAYLIYTSGSTGKPKAAVVSHRGLANMTANQRDVLRLDETSSVLHVAATSFDASVFEITMALCSGASLVVSPPDVFAGDDLVRVIADGGVTHAVMTPSVLAGLDPESVPSVSTVISVGEACPPELVDRWADAGRSFFNLYGPTEATIWATAAGPLAAGDEVTIGRVVPGVGALVLDGGLRPVPVGVAGELFLTGDQLALGYLGRPELTAARFVASPFGAEGTRMYRTGDRVTRLADGSFRYLGRTDFQLKIRGMRVEPGEVDGALSLHPDVAMTLTVGAPGPSGGTVLVSYAAPRGGARLDPVALRAHAAGLLPAHLVPHTVVPVETFVTNTVGKIDRSALPAVDFAADRVFVAPRDDAERLVAEVFAAELGTDRVSVTDDFFALGGTSLSAVAVSGRLGKLRGRRIALRDVFEHPSAAELAAFLDTADVAVEEPLRRRAGAGPVPVSGAQRSMWLVNSVDRTSSAYNIALALRLEGPLDTGAMRGALDDVLARHEALRTVYPLVDTDPVQAVVPRAEAAARVEFDVRDAGDDLPGAIAAVTGRGFDLAADLPLRAALLRTGDDHVLVLSIHHISADGASMAPLAVDMMTAYAARVSGTAPTWHELPIQYSDFADWQARRLAAVGADGRTLEQRQLDFWRDALADAPSRLELPIDRIRPKNPSFVGDAVDFVLGAETVAALDRLGRSYGASLFMVTHAAYAILLARLAGQRDVVVGTPYAGRDNAVLEPLVGMFVNTLALRSRVDPGERFVDVLDRVRVDDLAAMANADVAFDDIVARTGTGAGSSSALFQAMFVFQNLAFPRVEIAGLTVSAEDEQLTSAKVDVQLTLFPSDPKDPTAAGDVRGQLVYSTDVFARSTGEAMVERYVRLVEAIAADPEAIVGDIDLDERIDEAAGDAPRGLSDLVADAAAAIPTAVAAEHDGSTVTFGDIEATIGALEAAMPGTDRDSLLTMTLMSLLPTVGPAGPAALEGVLAMLRANASPADAR
ncbi:non-ribosomal peptide synthetase [Gordonia spumicola]|nr:non-ribosomal peptide synthetase [Gordonia spumicola]